LVDELGNDDLWANSGVLATLTDETGQATTLGRYLSIEYSVSRKTRFHLAMPGSPSIALSPGDVRRFAASPAANGTVTLQVRYCNE